ncbi:hypothetical protein [Klenkia sp. PcliD-1-E]|uniref:hypothetical protein n=1 Tax=Klenkia sp. PcliD-1-E TaxID=2954492 RepID=UPI002098204C|nr:hypothetical protein [Klenkia sp. PcliD-1-E]MCO7218361.1 hypothetical protein [Klenkia sp. PcliD-1-E]
MSTDLGTIPSGALVLTTAAVLAAATGTFLVRAAAAGRPRSDVHVLVLLLLLTAVAETGAALLSTGRWELAGVWPSTVAAVISVAPLLAGAWHYRSSHDGQGHRRRGPGHGR